MTFWRRLILCLSAISLSCGDMATVPIQPEMPGDQVTITQGIWGKVTFWDGDFMPTIPQNSPGSITPVEREVWIFRATRYDSVESLGGGFYKQILTQLVLKTRSNDRGFYQAALQPGKYSVFVREGLLFYGNGTDSAGHIVSGVVKGNALTEVPVAITYKATF
jgi:hypothetical protein